MKNELSAMALLDAAGLVQSHRSLCFEFFVVFTRFEYALKRNGFCRSNESGDVIGVDWDKAAASLEKTCGHEITQFRSSGAYIFSVPPRKQTRTGQDFTWRDSNTETMGEARRALHLLSTVRNNLFHGGKWPSHPVSDPSRDSRLIADAVKLLQLIVESHPKLRASFIQF